MALTRLGRTLTEEHRQQQLGIRAAAMREVVSLWSMLNPRRLDDAQTDWLRATMGAVRRRRAASIDAASEYYARFADAEGYGNAADPPSVPDLDETRLATSLLATGPLRVKHLTARGYTPERAAQTSTVTSGGSAVRLALDGARQALELGAQRDRVRFFRVTDSDPCAWCAMLASRGPVYTRETAVTVTERGRERAPGEDYHDFCACLPEPCFDPDAVNKPETWPALSREFHDLWSDATGGADGVAKWHAFREAYDAEREPAESPSAGKGAQAAPEAESPAAPPSDVDVDQTEAQPLDDVQAQPEAADDLTASTDDDLAERLDRAAADGDYDALDALAGEMQRREDVAAQTTPAELAAAEVPVVDEPDLVAWDDDEQEALYQQFETLVAAGWDDESAAAEVYGRSAEQQRRDRAITSLRAQGFIGRGFDDLARKAYRTFIYDRYIAAENAARGHLLNAEGERANVDPLDLFTGTAARARKYASDELKQWWDTNGRVTFEQYTADLLGDVQASRRVQVRTGAEDWLQ